MDLICIYTYIYIYVYTYIDIDIYIYIHTFPVTEMVSCLTTKGYGWTSHLSLSLYIYICKYI